ncbi:MAG: methyltransferase domain-containing protein, partial [Myxococcales bacterium]|nr:methyltransferase domain-containing protein [Myxococcales bacterium]
IRGARLDEGARALDVGCGVGGFATWLARERGCQVEAITVVPHHVDAARELALERGVAARCRFRVMDMNALVSPPGRFDLVVNQETVMYALDKRDYLARVRRALVPGGRWHAIDMSIRTGSLSGAERRMHELACRSWAMTPLLSPPAAIRLIRGAGFEDVSVEDVTERTLPSARRILEYCDVAERHLSALPEVKLRAVPELAALRRHVAGGRAYSLGLLQGVFRHTCYYARAPG